MVELLIVIVLILLLINTKEHYRNKYRWTKYGSHIRPECPPEIQEYKPDNLMEYLSEIKNCTLNNIENTNTDYDKHIVSCGLDELDKRTSAGTSRSGRIRVVYPKFDKPYDIEKSNQNIRKHHHKPSVNPLLYSGMINGTPNVPYQVTPESLSRDGVTIIGKYTWKYPPLNI